MSNVNNNKNNNKNYIKTLKKRKYCVAMEINNTHTHIATQQ